MLNPALRSRILNPTAIGGAAGGGAYQAHGVSFNASPYFLRGGGLTSAVDSKVGICSFWFWMKGGNSANQDFFDITGASNILRIQVQRRSTNVLWFLAQTSAPGVAINGTSSATYTTSMSAYAHCLMAWDAANAFFKIYVDDADVTAGGATINDANIDYTATNASVGAYVTGANLVNAWVSDLYFNSAEFLDITVEANRRKFRSAGGSPVDLGANGSAPTGNQPIVFFSGDAATWTATGNKGYGGAFSLTGTLNDATTDPP